MPDWLIERGIGETRCALVDGGEIVEARILLDGLVRAGTLVEATLKSSGTPAVAMHEGEEYLLAKGAPGVTQGGRLSIEIVRERMPGNEPWKRALARVGSGPSSPDEPVGETLPFPAPSDRLGRVGWNDVIEEARSGTVAFAGGTVRISPTPAMTLIDVDGPLPADELAVRGAAAAAGAVRRLDIGGSIGIDLPTVRGRDARQAAAGVIDSHLPQPFERTAVNGFGFIQIIRPRRRASLIELAQDRAGFEARALLRTAAFDGSGARCLVAHPRVIAALEAQPEWIDRLALQLGGTVTLRAEPAVSISGGYAEKA